MKFNAERLCRVDGQQPTLREKWTAFYRVVRTMARNDPHWNGNECLRVLFADWSWISLIESTGDPLENKMPRYMRWQIVRQEREHRLDAGAQRLLAAIMADEPE